MKIFDFLLVAMTAVRHDITFFQEVIQRRKFFLAAFCLETKQRQKKNHFVSKNLSKEKIPNTKFASKSKSVLAISLPYWLVSQGTVKGFVLCKYTECGIIWTGTWGRQIIIIFRWISLEMETLVNGKFCDEQQEISKQVIGLCSAILASCAKHNACHSPVNQCETALIWYAAPAVFFSFFFLHFYITLFGEFKKKKNNKKIY